MRYITCIDDVDLFNNTEIYKPNIVTIEDDAEQLIFVPEDGNDYTILKTENNNLSIIDIDELWNQIKNNNYKLQYEDIDYKQLEQYDTFQYNINLIPCNVAPPTAKYITVYDSNGNKIDLLPLKTSHYNLRHTYATKQYSVGLISDVHYNDTCDINSSTHTSSDTGNTFNPYEDLEHILNYFKSSTDVEFISCAGDLSTDTIDEVQAFSIRVNNIVPEIPVYSCKGNHDNKSTYGNNDKWLSLTIPKNSVSPINFFSSGDKTSFYFLKDSDVYIYLNVDYNSGANTISTTLLSDNTSYQFYDPDVLKEFQLLLDTYRNQRCFVFTHLFFPNKAGNCYYDYTVNRSHSYWLSGVQFALLNEMNNYYINSLWFSGHSHYQWKWQSIDSRSNICDFDILNNYYNYNDYNDFAKNSNNAYDLQYHSDVLKSAQNIHIPSACRPLKPLNYLNIENYNDAIADPGAECAIMDVYEEGVLIKGIVCADENSTIEPIIDNIQTVKASDIRIDVSKTDYIDGDLTIEQLDDNIIRLTFNATARRFYITNYISLNVKIDYVKLYINSKDVTNDFISLENPYIGIYNSNGIYSLSSTTAMITSAGTDSDGNSLSGIEIPCSSKFSTENIPVTLDIRLYTYTSTKSNINYDDKYQTICTYWLETKMSTLETKDYSYFEETIKNFDK